MGVKFFFDEGLGPNLVIGLRAFGKDVEHLLEKFSPGTKDEVWLKYVGENKLILVTKDKGIRKKPNEKALLLRYGVVAFYLGGSEKSGHDILKQLANAWENMESTSAKHVDKGIGRAFIVRPNGRKIEELPLT